MDLVDGHRGMVVVALRSNGHPLSIAPAVGRGKDAGGVSGWQLHIGGERIRLQAQIAVLRFDLVLVNGPRLKIRDEKLEDAGSAQRAHREEPTIPTTEVSHHAHPARVRGPDGEGDAIDAIDMPNVRTE